MTKARRWYKVIVLLSAAACAIALAACTPMAMIEATPTPTPTPEPRPLEITYIDSDCFLFVSGGQKILVDAHATLPDEIRTAIEEAEPPFDEIDLVLATHIHADHFDPRLVGTYLAQNPSALFASTEEAMDELRAVLSPFEAVQERVIAFEPEIGKRVRASLNGIDLEVLNLPHDAPVVNLGFIITLGGRKLLHPGDTFPPHIEVYDFPADNLDVAFVPYFFLFEEDYQAEDGESVLLDMIQAEWIVPMHYSPTIWDLEDILEETLMKSSQACMVFRERMETQVLE